MEDGKWSAVLEELSGLDRSRVVKVLNQLADTMRLEWTAAEPSATSSTSTSTAS